MTTPSGALNDLRGNPKRFLQEYYLKISRSTVTGEAMYWLSAYSHEDLAGRTVYERAPRPGRFLGNLHTHDSKMFKLEPYELAPRLAGQGVTISAHHVPVVHSNALNIGTTQVPRGGAVADIMVTTLLNGCTFVCQEVGNNVLMAHVQPIGLTGQQLATNITNGAFNIPGTQAGTLRSFGPNVYNSQTEEATIIGVRTGRKWRVFAQLHPQGGDRRILRVVEVFVGSA
jgi:hypothetical protein